MTLPDLPDALMALITYAAFFGMMLGPIAAAFGSWALATRVRYGWVAHILLVPALVALDWVLALLMFWGARADSDGPVGLGALLLFAVAILAVTVVSYYGTLIWRGAAAR